MLQEDGIMSVKGVGEKAVEKYQKIDIETVGDLLEHYPRDYDEVRPIREIRTIKEGELVAIEANMVSRPQMKLKGSLKILTTVMTDHSGKMLDVTWFNMPFLKNQLHMGTVYILRGRVAKKRDRLVMEQPKIYTKQEFYNIVGKLRPIYPLTKGLTNNAIIKSMEIALKESEDILEYLPKDIRTRNNLIGYKKAVKDIHFPKQKEDLREARRRLVFDELFLYILALKHIKQSAIQKKSTHLIKRDPEVEEFKNALPFDLTNAQDKAYDEIMKDMASGNVMSRLVQGDVGSGKTIVALLCLYEVVKNGYQGALMVPTEVLASQHVKTFQGMLGDRLVVDQLTGAMTAKEKKTVKERLKAGEIDIIIGTHALLQEDVEFSDLGMVVTDEQHRFGVRQRETFFKKGEEPHVLAMSATPIPRTLALILYGDMDLTVIDEKPANRLPVKNALVGTNYRENAYVFMQKRINDGEQCYVICPMVDESEDSDLENVTIYAEELRTIMPPAIRIEALHGRMKPKQKDEIMEKFAAHEIDILVSTTVIEVGIDVPNATTMLIENAERFGLATLHQLRGRIGRGSAQSYCIFMMGVTTQESKERLQVLERSNDGFYVASEDLKNRGQGDLFGTLQSGEKVFTLADIYEDASILEAAAEEAKKYSLEKLFSEQKDLTNVKRSFQGVENQNIRLMKKISQYMGDVTL